MTVAEAVAEYLGEHCPVVFGIIGAGNMGVFDAIARLGRTTIVYCHHEQAAVMAALGYQRVSGITTAVLVTTGAGSSNALTGALSAFMDSIPVVIIAGNEASTQPRRGRHIGVQGYDSAEAAKPFVKWAATLNDQSVPRGAIERAFAVAVEGRPGPAWLTIPMDLASAAA